MVIDTSALVAILFDEPDRSGLTRAIEADPVRLVSAATVPEASMVVETRRGEPAARELDLLLHRAQARTVEVTARHAELARSVWRRYGKGRHPAGLNYGDCFPARSRSPPGNRCCSSATISPGPTYRPSRCRPRRADPGAGGGPARVQNNRDCTSVTSRITNSTDEIPSTALDSQPLRPCGATSFVLSSRSRVTARNGMKNEPSTP